MLEKKKSFKSHFINFTTLTVKHLFDLLTQTGFNSFFDTNELTNKLEKLDPLLRANNSFIVVSNTANFSMPYVSKTCESIIGYSNKEWEDQGISFLSENYCQADVRSGECSFNKFMEHQKNTSLEDKNRCNYVSTFRFYHKKGYFIWIYNHVVFIFNDENGKHICSLSIFTKIDHVKFNDNCIYQAFEVNKTGSHPKLIDTYSYKPYGSESLSPTDIRILKLLSHGLNNAQVAAELGLSTHTVKEYRKRMLKKTWCSNITELMYFAFRNGIIS